MKREIEREREGGFPETRRGKKGRGEKQWSVDGSIYRWAWDIFLIFIFVFVFT